MGKLSKTLTILGGSILAGVYIVCGKIKKDLKKKISENYMMKYHY